MANEHAVESDDKRAEAAAQKEDAPAELASASMYNPQEEDAAGKLANTSMNDRYDANEHNPQGVGSAEPKSGSGNSTSYAIKCNPQQDRAAEPVLASMDLSSDVNKDTRPEEGAAADLTRASTDKVSDAVKNAHADVLAKGIASVLGPVMNDFDGRVEGALKSQSILASSIDRLTQELDKLLEDVPLPFATQHATRLSGIRKRILTLNTSLRIIQRRMETIQRFLAGYASKAIAKDNQEKGSLFSMEQSYSTSHALSHTEVTPTKAMSSSSADDDKNDDGQLSNVLGTEISDQFGNIQSGGSPDNYVREELVSKNLHIDTSNQEPHDDQKPNDCKASEGISKEVA